MQIVRTVTTAKPLEPVFAYLSDFTTTTEWDPATVQTFRSHGDGGIGSEYLNTSTFLGRQTRLTYVVEELVPNRRIRLRGQNKTIVAIDTMTFGTVPDGTEIIYIADFTFNGVTRLFAPVLAPAFTRLGNHAAAGMRTALDQL